MGLRQIRLYHHFRLARIGDIARGEIFRNALMGEQEKAPTVGRDLNRHPLPHAAESVERMLRDQLEVPGDGLIRALLERALFGDGHGVLLGVSGNRRYEMAFPRSGRGDLSQSGMAEILFSRKRTPAWRLNQVGGVATPAACRARGCSIALRRGWRR